MESIDKKFVIIGNNVICVVKIAKDTYIPIDNTIIKNPDQVFDTKEDAMYRKLLRDLNNGKRLSNFKSSKYYKYYVERLIKENPEHLI